MVGISSVGFYRELIVFYGRLENQHALRGGLDRP